MSGEFYAEQVVVPFKIEASERCPEITGTVRPLSMRQYASHIRAQKAARKVDGEGKPIFTAEGLAEEYQGYVDMVKRHIVSWNLPDPITDETLDRLRNSVLVSLYRVVLDAVEGLEKN